MCKHKFELQGFVQKIVKGEFIQYEIKRCGKCGKLFYNEDTREDIYEWKGKI
jgi:hypothetical protein